MSSAEKVTTANIQLTALGVIIMLCVGFFGYAFISSLTTPAQSASREQGMLQEVAEKEVSSTRECDASGKNCRVVRSGYNPICEGKPRGVPFRCTPPGFTHEVDGCRCDDPKR